MNREKLWQNQKFHRKNHTQCKLKRERNIMFVCAENPRTSRYVMDLMQDPVLDIKLSQLQKQDSLRFADASTAQMKPVSVTELTAHCRAGLIEFSFFSLASPILDAHHHHLSKLASNKFWFLFQLINFTIYNYWFNIFLISSNFCSSIASSGLSWNLMISTISSSIRKTSSLLFL